VLVLLAWVARIGPLRLVRGSFVALPFLLAAVPIIFLGPGEPIATLNLGPITLDISGEGLALATTVVLKSWLSVQVALLLTFTTPFHDLLDAMRELRVPRLFVAIIGFMYRYLAVLGDEAQRIMRARAARSAEPEDGRGGGSIAWRARVTGGMVGALFLRTYERSERIYAAMQARGFEGTFRHMELRPVQPAEWATLLAALLLLAAWLAAAHFWGLPS
jgi:cobalt/nickel transport system permease protein